MNEGTSGGAVLRSQDEAAVTRIHDLEYRSGTFRAWHLYNFAHCALVVLFVSLGCAWWGQSMAETAQATRADAKQIQDIDRHRDNKLRSQALDKARKVWRYVTKDALDKDKKQGISAREHMTSGVHPGHPPKPTTAQKQYGLLEPPVARESIVVPRGHPVKKAKVLGGEPGRGEITSSRKLPPSTLKATTPLKQPTNRKNN